LSEAIGWIKAAGGIAVIAHPGRYRLTSAERRELYVAFKDCGGQGIEVVSGSSNENEIREFAGIAREFGFLASRASDFHGPGESHIDLGRMAKLPPDLTPVWAGWER
jgi:3',5'-nucleoside bisphosphate phosphatase